ncbi:MAG: DUF1802 family protein [Candidatus Omnitrophica bacterium]|nr:DUF1802 family protein [Candidatus Omnitrophota bacterium]
MLESNRIAFKEWASVVEVLGKGEQILILRKGGIHEKGKKFDVAHEEFFLFPTSEHQNPKDLKPEGAGILERVLANRPEPNVLPIQYYSVVEDSFWISDEKTLHSLNPFHIWSWECIKARYEWGEEKGLFGIVIRAYAYPEPLKLENLKRYGGCRSWVEFDSLLQTSSLVPVLSDSRFMGRKKEIEKALKGYLAPRS